ncbi:MAG: hypothetical protein U5L01_01635 [Rheinheimera sp.]|nr:hypothetical protein [Rheinheimera sp.]
MPFLVAFFSSLWSTFISWTVTAYLTGALRSLAINLVLFTVIFGLLYNLITTANEYLLTAIQGMSPMKQMILAPIASMMPPSLSLCVSIVASVYMLGAGYNIAKEIAKMKARAAERAAGFFKA